MTHRQHSSWKSGTAKAGTTTAARYRRLQETAQQAEAEGQFRPEPGLTPPMTYDEHFAAKVAEIKAEQEAREA